MSGRARLRRNLRSAGLIGCGAALLGWLGDLNWSLELFSHFRAQYLAGLMLIGWRC